MFMLFLNGFEFWSQLKNDIQLVSLKPGYTMQHNSVFDV